MKFTIVALCIIGYTFAAQGTPKASSACIGNVDNATTCSACYNDGLNTKTGAREFLGAACAKKVTNTVASCKYYNPGITATKAITDCIMCNATTWLNITDSATASTIAITCSATSISTGTCATAVANCAQSSCYKSTTSTYAKRCSRCSAGYKGSGTLTTNVGYMSCVTQTIANCSVGHPLNALWCFIANASHVVSANRLTAVSFTTDANCRKLSAGGTWCGECKDGYLFDSKTCKLGAQLMAISGLIMALFFFN